MNLPRRQRVSDALHHIAELVQEADGYLHEGKYAPLSAFKPLKGVARVRPTNKLKPVRRPKNGANGSWPWLVILPMPAGLQPHKQSPLEKIDRRMRERLLPPARDVLRARRERKARDRYHALKNVVAAPRKVLGSRLRKR